MRASPISPPPCRTLCSSSTPQCRAPSWRSFQRQAGTWLHRCLLAPGSPLMAEVMLVGSTCGCLVQNSWAAARPSLTHPRALPCHPQAGSAEDWGSGVALPETVLRRATVTLENLSHVSRGDQEVGSSCCLCRTLQFVARGIVAWGREERIVRLAGWHPVVSC